MSLHADDELPSWVPLGKLPYCLPEIAVYRLQPIYPLQESVIATDAQWLTPLCVRRQSDQIACNVIVKSQRRADSAADAILLVQISRVAVVVPPH
jgi:hypothetical protein